VDRMLELLCLEYGWQQAFWSQNIWIQLFLARQGKKFGIYRSRYIIRLYWATDKYNGLNSKNMSFITVTDRWTETVSAKGNFDVWTQ
jgi:hypothetical protein